MDILVFESCSNDPTYNCKKPELEKCTIPWINEMGSKFFGIIGGHTNDLQIYISPVDLHGKTMR